MNTLDSRFAPQVLRPGDAVAYFITIKELMEVDAHCLNG